MYKISELTERFLTPFCGVWVDVQRCNGKFTYNGATGTDAYEFACRSKVAALFSCFPSGSIHTNGVFKFDFEVDNFEVLRSTSCPCV